MATPEPGTTRGRPWWLLAVAALVLAGAGWVLREVVLAQQPPDGPQPVAWDRVACAHCRMLVSEPRFAAQAHTHGGAVHHFDDPGCALLWADAHQAELHELWFRDTSSERWLRRDETAFVDAAPTPMGYGLGARPLGTPGALPPAEALARVKTRDAAEAAP